MVFNLKARVLRDPLHQEAQVFGSGKLDCLMAGSAEQVMSVHELSSNISDAAIFQMYPPEITKLGQQGDRSVYRHQPERPPISASEREQILWPEPVVRLRQGSNDGLARSGEPVAGLLKLGANLVDARKPRFIEKSFHLGANHKGGSSDGQAAGLRHTGAANRP